ncbi:hypothetical protein BC629DRAFT_1440981 [Irpex lacteus]|nr:hypothetical protein BC629DRAFT_1440981 [Irpex lacteus]
MGKHNGHLTLNFEISQNPTHNVNASSRAEAMSFAVMPPSSLPGRCTTTKATCSISTISQNLSQRAHVKVKMVTPIPLLNASKINETPLTDSQEEDPCIVSEVPAHWHLLFPKSFGISSADRRRDIFKRQISVHKWTKNLWSHRSTVRAARKKLLASVEVGPTEWYRVLEEVTKLDKPLKMSKNWDSGTWDYMSGNYDIQSVTLLATIDCHHLGDPTQKREEYPGDVRT